MDKSLTLREATAADIPMLACHRRRMAFEIAERRGIAPDVAGWQRGEPAYVAYLQAHLADGLVKAWVVEHAGQVVASGVVTVLPWPPGGGDGSPDEGRSGLLHSVYTEVEWRRRGCARRILQAAIDHCRSCGFRTMLLGASEQGRPLYESLGFQPATTMMRLRLR